MESSKITMEKYRLKARSRNTQNLLSICPHSKCRSSHRKKNSAPIDILIIDDEPHYGETLKDLLEDEGYSVTIKTNGEDGLSFLQDNACFVAIIDIMLPDKSGIEILKAIKEGGITCLPIMLTGHATLETSIRALNEGAYAYIVKPHSIEAVKHTVRNAYEKQRLSLENWALLENLKASNRDLMKVKKDLEYLNRDLELKVLERTKELCKEKGKIDKILTCIADGLLSFDQDLKITSFNKAAEQITGYSAEEAIGKYCWEILSHGNCDNCLNLAIDLKRPIVNIERVIYTKSNKPKTILTSIDVLRDESGAPIGGVKTFRDITMLKHMQEELKKRNDELLKNQRKLEKACKELKKSKEKLSDWAKDLDKRVHIRTKELQEINEQLNQANIKLTELDKMKSQFLATVTHELKTPLTSIIGYTNLMVQMGEMQNQQKDILMRIQRNSQVLEDLIEQLLDLSMIESGKIEMNIERFSLKEVIEESIYITEPFLLQKGITIKTCIPEHTLHISADRGKVKQIILNLLTNAVKYTEREPSEITIRVSQKQNMVTVCVEDQGIGIAPEDQKIIFDPFSRASRSPKKYSGTGLGLSIAKEFVKLHGGDIWVESTPGEGSLFTFTLPPNGAK